MLSAYCAQQRSPEMHVAWMVGWEIFGHPADRSAFAPQRAGPCSGCALAATPQRSLWPCRHPACRARGAATPPWQASRCGAAPPISHIRFCLFPSCRSGR